MKKNTKQVRFDPVVDRDEDGFTLSPDEVSALWYTRDHFVRQRSLQQELTALTNYTPDELWDLFGYPSSKEETFMSSRVRSQFAMHCLRTIKRSNDNAVKDTIARMYSIISKQSMAFAHERAKKLETQLLTSSCSSEANPKVTKPDDRWR